LNHEYRPRELPILFFFSKNTPSCRHKPCHHHTCSHSFVQFCVNFFWEPQFCFFLHFTVKMFNLEILIVSIRFFVLYIYIYIYIYTHIYIYIYLFQLADKQRLRKFSKKNLLYFWECEIFIFIFNFIHSPLIHLFLSKIHSI
jgi:hypothetical protein